MDALVLAGGRIDDAFAEAAGTLVKGMAPVGGEPMLRRVAVALRETPGVRQVCVVGPDETRDAVPPGCIWQRESQTAFDNVLAGFARVDAEDGAQVLVCGADVPAITPAGAADLLQRTPSEADFALPVVRKEHLQRRFPGDTDLYVSLREGAVTGGSQYIIRAGVLRRNRELLLRLFAQRKSQLGMASTLGLPFILKLLSRRLTIAEVERRASTLTSSSCRAVMDCHPELAFDVDTLEEWRFIQAWFDHAR